MNNQPTSLTLLEQAQSGSEQAWEDLKALYKPLIYFWIRERGIRGGDVEVLHANVLGNVFLGMQRFQHNGRAGAFRAWVKTIASHAISDFRKSMSTKPLPEETLVDPDQSIEQHEASQERRILYQRAWELVQSEFSDRDQAIFRRVVENEEAGKNVAEDLGVQRSNVYRIVSQIKSRIRQRFHGEVLFEDE